MPNMLPMKIYTNILERTLLKGKCHNIAYLKIETYSDDKRYF